MADRESEKRRAFCRRVLILVKELVEKGLGARREAIGRERWDFRFCRLWPILNFGSVFPFSHLRRLERVFRCCSVCETMEDYKEGYLMVWANYMSPCNSIAGLYFEGTCDVISVTMATHKVHKNVH